MSPEVPDLAADKLRGNAQETKRRETKVWEKREKKNRKNQLK
jgi:hypothetical protein